MKQYNGYKYCPRCECVYPIKFFYNNRAQPNGLEQYCKDCKKEYNKENMEVYLNAGLCQDCGKPIDFLRSFRFCEGCLEKIRIRVSKRRHRLLSLGLCIDCGKRPLYTTYRCYKCTIRNNENNRIRLGTYNPQYERDLLLIKEYLEKQRLIKQ